MSDPLPTVLPVGQDLPLEAIDARFDTTDVHPAANPDFAFRAQVPKGWQADALEGMDRPVDARRMTPLAGWHAPRERGQPVVFHVQGLGLMRSMSAAHFTLAYAKQQGLRPVSMREMGPYLADALLEQPIQGHLFGLRMATRIDGDRAFILSGLAHEDDLAAFNETFGVMIRTFEVLTRAESPYVERRVRRRLLDAIEFDAPASWRAMPVSDGTDTHQAVDLFQKGPSGEYTGLIRVDHDTAGGDPSLDDELRYVAANVSARGVELFQDIRELDGDGPAEGPLRLVKSVVLPGKAGNDVPQEVWISILRVNGAPLRVWMVGPARDAFFEPWAINQRGYRILLETLRAL